MSEEDLQIAEKRREMKGKGEKERYTHLNAEFQRIARRDKKDFLSDQCKETEERLEISSRKLGTISCKDGHNKGQKWCEPNRSRRYLKEVARIHRRTEQKGLNDPDNHDGVVTHL